MSIRAVFLPGQTDVTVNGLYQWDCGQQLEIHASDLPPQVEVHFSSLGMQEAAVIPCDMTTGVGSVGIPNKCLEQSAPIRAWIYAISGNTGATVKTITLNVTERARPESAQTVPEEIADKYTQAVAAMNSQVESMKKGSIVVAKAKQADRATQADKATQADRATQADTASLAYGLYDFRVPFSVWENYEEGQVIAGGMFLVRVPLGTDLNGRAEYGLAWLATGGETAAVATSTVMGTPYTEATQFSFRRVVARPTSVPGEFWLLLQELDTDTHRWWDCDRGVSFFQYRRISYDQVG